MYHKLIIVGNLGRDPEMRYTPNGTAVTNFSVAVNRRWTDGDGNQNKETTWFRVTAWRRLAEVCDRYLQKGRQVLVEGYLKPDPDTGGPRIWTGNDGAPRASYEMTARTVKFLGRAPAGAATGQGEGGSGPEDVADEIPF